MSYLLEEELAAQGIFTKTTLKIRLNYKVYVRVKTLPMKFYERAKKLKEEYTAKNLDSLLIEHKNWIAVWIEELNKLDEIENNYFYRVKDLSSTVEDTSSQLKQIQEKSSLDRQNSSALQEFASKPLLKKYRGVTYKDNVSDDSPSLTESEKLTRKYRGIIYQSEVSDNMSNPPSDRPQSEQSKRKYRGRSY